MNRANVITLIEDYTEFLENVHAVRSALRYPPGGWGNLDDVYRIIGLCERLRDREHYLPFQALCRRLCFIQGAIFGAGLLAYDDLVMHCEKGFKRQWKTSTRS